MHYIILFFLFIVFPICGFQALLDGDIGLAFFFFFPLAIFICYIVVNYCVVVPHEKRQKALRKKFNIPEVNTELYNHVWDKEFDKIINNAIATTTDPSKLYDLQECQKVVQQMKGHSFDMIYHAFRLTGCHFTITDSDGKIITKIV